MAEPSPRRLLTAGLVAWFAALGVDFLAHGGLLARLYAEPEPFLLPPRELFARIPLGYAAFGILTALVTTAGWL